MVDIAKEFFSESVLIKYFRVLSFLKKIEKEVEKQEEIQKNIKKELKDLANLPPTKENIARRRELAKLVADHVNVQCQTKEEAFLANNYKKFKPIMKKDQKIKDHISGIVPNSFGLRKIVRAILN